MIKDFLQFIAFSYGDKSLELVIFWNNGFSAHENWDDGDSQGKKKKKKDSRFWYDKWR